MKPDKLVFIAILSTSSGCASDAAGWATLDGVGVLGVSADGEAYICGLDDAADRSQWLVGDGGVLSDEGGAWSLEVDGDGSFSLSAADGEVWDGTLTSFDDGGLYDAEPEDCRSGAILYDGVLAGTWCDGLGVFRQVEPVDAIVGGPRSIEVRVLGLSDYTFTIQRLP